MEGEKYFSELDLNTLSGSPRIWIANRVLVKEGREEAGESLLEKSLSKKALPEARLLPEDRVLEISGGEIIFKRELRDGGWTLLEAEESTHEIKREISYYLIKLTPAVIVLGVLIVVAITIQERRLEKKK